MPLSTAGALLDPFVNLKPLYQDVLHDMGDSEECLIDGESLFLEVLLHPRCPAAFSGAPLQLNYYVESFLAKLRGHGGRFRIVFFREYGLIWSSIPEVAALREVLIAHLLRSLPSHTIRVFSCWWSPPDDQPQPQLRRKGKAKANAKPNEDPTHEGDGGKGLDACFLQLLNSMRPAFVLVSSLLSELQELQRLAGAPKASANATDAAADAAAGNHQRRATGPAPSLALLADSAESRRRLLSSPQLQLAAELSMGLLLHCLRAPAAVVLLSSLDLTAATRPFGFIVEPGGRAARVLNHFDTGIASVMRALLMRCRREDVPGEPRREARQQAPGCGKQLLEQQTPPMLPQQQQEARLPPQKQKKPPKPQQQHPFPRFDDEGEGDAVAWHAAWILAQEGLHPAALVSPRAALAAAVCARLPLFNPGGGQAVEAACGTGGGGGGAGGSGKSGGGHGKSSAGGDGGGGVRVDATTLWLCEVYLLHAVLLDYMPLEQRALALPYGELRSLYDASQPRPKLKPAAAAAAAAAATAAAAEAVPNAADTEPATSAGAVAARLASIDGDVAATSQLSLRLQSFLAEQVLPRVAAAVRSREWERANDAEGGDDYAGGGGGGGDAAARNAAVQQGQGKASKASQPSTPSVSPPPPPPPLLLPLSPDTGGALADPYQGTLLHALVVALLVMKPAKADRPPPLGLLLGLPPAAVASWQAARQVAGLPLLPPGGGPDDGGGGALLSYILSTMPCSSNDRCAAKALHALLALPGDAAAVGGHGSGGGDEGPPAMLDRRAQAVLLEACGLPEPLRCSPVVKTVEQLWHRVAPAAAAAAGDEAPSSVGDGVVTTAASACGGGASARRKAKAAAAGPWGPWEELVTAVLGGGRKDGRGGRVGGAAGGFDGGDIAEVYHWHSRHPLQPAFLTQSDSRDARRERVLRNIGATPTEALLARFSMFMYGRDRWRVGKLLDDVQQGVRKPVEARMLVLERVQNYFQSQKTKEEASLKRLIDSMQGGVTFFRVGRAGGGGGGSTHPREQQQQQTFQLVVSSLSEVSGPAHLEAIRRNREGKAALEALLKEAKMSAADLKRRLGAPNNHQAKPAIAPARDRLSGFPA